MAGVSREDRASATKTDLDSVEAGRGNGATDDKRGELASDLDDGEDSASTPRKILLQSLASPWIVYPVFVLAMVSCATSAAITLSIHGAAPISLAGWRHQVTAIVLFPGFIYQSTRLSKVDRQRAVMPGNVGLLCVSSLAFACNFGLYVWALYHTSMTHCVFLISMPQIFVVIFTVFTRGYLLKGEVFGVALGALGVAILAAGTNFEGDSEGKSTHFGDFVSLCAAASFAVYLVVGKSLRSWMPLFVYQLPVVIGSAAILAVWSVLAEGSDTSMVSSPLGWLGKDLLLGTVLLGVIPGALGHSAYSFVLKFLPPLVTPMGLSVQPITSCILGWLVGVSAFPGLWTFVGGVVTICGTFCVSISSENHKAGLHAKAEEASQHGQTFTENEGKEERAKSIPQCIPYRKSLDDLHQPLLS